MLARSLEFAPGTTEDCQKRIVGMFDPNGLLQMYSAARRKLSTGDLVMIVPQSDPSEVRIISRAEYVKDLRANLGDHAARTLPQLGVANSSAHKIVKLPEESDAFWIVVVRPQDTPIEAVLFSLPYETGSANVPLIGEA